MRAPRGTLLRRGIQSLDSYTKRAGCRAEGLVRAADELATWETHDGGSGGARVALGRARRWWGQATMTTQPILAAILTLAILRSAQAQTATLAPLGAASSGAAGDTCGWSVALGDLDGDGRADVISGATGASDAGSGGAPLIGRGKVTVHSSATGQVILTVLGVGAFERFGSAVDVVPDVSGDGLPDLLVGAAGSGHALGPAPYARLVASSDGSTLATFVGGHPFERFGETVVCTGDADLDGFVDFLIGGAGSTNAHPGVVRMMRGGSSFPSQEVLWERTGFTNENLGDSACALGDVNGDGVPDVAVGAPGFDGAALNMGAVFVLRGESGSPIAQIFPTVGQSRFGRTIAALGAYSPKIPQALAIGAFSPKDSEGASGRITLVNPRTGKKILVINSSVAQTRVGDSLAGIGDVTGDGIPDLATGASGDFVLAPQSNVFVISGATGSRVGAVSVPSDDLMADGTGTLSGLGDFDGDGRSDLVAGAWNATLGEAVQAGEARVYSLAGMLGLGQKGKLSAKIALRRPLVPGDPDALGVATLLVDGTTQSVSVDLAKLQAPAGDTLEAFLEEQAGSGVFVEIAELTKTAASGSWKAKLTNPAGLPPQAQVGSLFDLVGRTLEIRDGAGVAHLTAELPPLFGLDDLTLKSPMEPTADAPGGSKSQLSLTVKKTTGSSGFEITTKGLPISSACSAFLEDPPGSGLFAEVGALSKGKLKLDTKLGSPLPLGLPSLLALVGRRLELRAGATVLFHRTLALEL